MKTLVWLLAIIALSAFIFSATVNAATTLAESLKLNANSHNSIEQIINR